MGLPSLARERLGHGGDVAKRLVRRCEHGQFARSKLWRQAGVLDQLGEVAEVRGGTEDIGTARRLCRHEARTADAERGRGSEQRPAIVSAAVAGEGAAAGGQSAFARRSANADALWTPFPQRIAHQTAGVAQSRKP